ncbi:MAG: DNA-binding protein [Deltaproteobacteria bacterium RBG_16_48_10]|nr:MAG: DNA-binding protein [Deltaproteobacteria bacterium RBG_16_48_10]
MKRDMVDYTTLDITTLIITVRGKRVILDTDLARIYGVPTKRLNEQVRRNTDRFPPDFAFVLTDHEVTNLRSQFATGSHGGRRYRPYVFTEHGALMAANILRGERAIQMSVFVVRAFIRMRQMLIEQRDLARKLAELEKELTARLDLHESAITEMMRQIRQLLSPPPEPEPPKKRIGFLVEEPHVPYKSSKGFKKQKRQ